MSYGILGNADKDWYCPQSAWVDHLNLAIAFGWVPEGPFFKRDEVGFGEHPSGSYLGNDWQKVTDTDARAMAAALNLAIATINAGSPMTDDQAMAVKAFEIDNSEPSWKAFLTEEQRAGFLELEANYLAAHPDEIRTIRTRDGTFKLNVRKMMDLADVASAGGFTIT